ncbi:alkaline phosphatase [Actinoplanes sp. SE50]|uniref:alkaline phosphatase D family protein n=1 Tax=unclassified Actinoplanes TaxID=2626549 RepID=UPI00023ECAE5|nr:MULTISPECIES: alkaline phosphatase D family protein [unclassified Actinoplanes]AEV83725.1 alkaline phosphatase [Actinoplanes sp. SE50/110]ATO82131.1 alkaline phosphatase [Actinoplanes sp. SE50]SLL99538.1 Alkaline phosphatase D precursor [Actinoplanes sp. SE50/110]
MLQLPRRRLFTLSGVALAGALPRPRLTNPFTLGVASGDPLPGGVLLWTRLAPRPLEPAGGLPPVSYPVDWQVAEDAKFSRVVRSGTGTAAPGYGHSVHVDVTGLRPGRDYFYRFRSQGFLSPTGRTRTAPAKTATPRALRFAVTSCQAYGDGYYDAWRHLAAESLDLVMFLGDYIYEGAITSSGGSRMDPKLHLPDTFELETDTLDLYRMRYALYRTDPDLQAAHAAFPWILTWDDHEVQDNYADGVSRFVTTPVRDFLVRRANAYRAYWENQPLRWPRQPSGPDMSLYRRFRFGDLAHAYVLDTRQYRSDQACGDNLRAGCTARDDPQRTLLGAPQRDWLLGRMGRSPARWNVLAQQIMMARCVYGGPANRLDMDKWDGYSADRQRVLELAARMPGTVVVSGDIHNNYACDLRLDFGRPETPPVAVELVGTSISSGGDGSDTTAQLDMQRRYNPHLKLANGQRGYVLCELGRDVMRADYRVMNQVTRRGGTISTRASFISERARAGLVPA